MTPEQYNSEREMDRRANLTPAEVYAELHPKMQRLVMRWAQEDAEAKAILGEPKATSSVS